MKRLTVEVLKARGSWLARCRGERGAGDGVSGRIVCPSWVSAEARATWRRVVAGLRAFGILRPADATALGRYCELWVLWRRLLAARDASPVNDPTTIRLERRALKVGESLLRLEAAFGMNPASRARLGVKTLPVVATPDSRLLRLLPSSGVEADAASDPGGDLDDGIPDST